MKSSSLRTILAVACAAAFAVATQSAFAQTPDAAPDKAGKHEGHEGKRGGRGPGGPPDAGKHLEKLTQELSLTADQQAKIKPILEAADARRKEIWDNAALSEDDKRAQMKAAHEGVQAQLNGVLTAEQQAKLETLKKEHGRGGHGPHGPDGGDKPAK
jgi:Spy/CpxP family protein refolding chaperone